jgi:hypothetical protein
MIIVNTLNIKKDFTFSKKQIYNGYQLIFMFSNGYGASVVEHEYSKGLEIAVLDSNNKITYDTPITNDVLGYLSDVEANEILENISKL